MKPRLVLVTEIIAPYRVPVFNALAARDDIDLHVVFLSETDSSLRQWTVPKNEIRFSCEVLPSFRRRVGRYNLLLNRRVSTALECADPDAIVCGGYNYVANWQSALWAKRRRIPLLLWIESNAADQRRHRLAVEKLKRKFISMCQGFIVPGTASAVYLRQFGIQEQRIFRAPNAVDNDMFVAGASRARSDADETRSRLGLPERYFLNVGRMVRAKGVFELLSAYAKLNVTLRSSVGLVFVGEGDARSELAEQAAQISPGNVQFRGFVQKEQLADYYALADALVFSTHSDPWGLVVNEAMACGLPVIASEVAGSVENLVRDGWNGFVIPSCDVEKLSVAMSRLGISEELRLQMGERGVQQIRAYSPEACAAGIARAVATVCEIRQ
jgi:glycosyltransferase involved in cell wall biosynthesis